MGSLVWKSWVRTEERIMYGWLTITGVDLQGSVKCWRDRATFWVSGNRLSCLSRMSGIPYPRAAVKAFRSLPFLLLSWLWIPGLHSFHPIQMHISPNCSLELEQVGFGIKQAWVPMVLSLSEGYSPDSSRSQEWWKMLISQDWCQDIYMYTNRCAYIHTVHIHTHIHIHTDSRIYTYI